MGHKKILGKPLEELGSLNEKDLKGKIEQHLKESEDKFNDLKSHSKPLTQLVVSEKFSIEEVISESYATYFSPQSEMIYGGYNKKCSRYNGGFISKLILKVLPDNKDVPIRVLNFEGISVVRAGDYISAKILKYEEKVDDIFGYDPEGKKFYVDRDFLTEESAIELAIISESGKVLRIDRAVDYSNFVNTS